MISLSVFCLLFLFLSLLYSHRYYTLEHKTRPLRDQVTALEMSVHRFLASFGIPQGELPFRLGAMKKLVQSLYDKIQRLTRERDAKIEEVQKLQELAQDLRKSFDQSSNDERVAWGEADKWRRLYKEANNRLEQHQSINPVPEDFGEIKDGTLF